MRVSLLPDNKEEERVTPVCYSTTEGERGVVEVKETRRRGKTEGKRGEQGEGCCIYRR